MGVATHSLDLRLTKGLRPSCPHYLVCAPRSPGRLAAACVCSLKTGLLALARDRLLSPPVRVCHGLRGGGVTAAGYTGVGALVLHRPPNRSAIGRAVERVDKHGDTDECRRDTATGLAAVWPA